MLTFTSRTGAEPLRCTFETAARGRKNRQVMEALSLCMREEYGDTYSDTRVYDVDALERMAAEDRLITSAALREDGEPVAVINLKECPPFEGVGDLSMHVVRRPFRSYGVGTPLVRHIVNLPEADGLTAVVSHSATYHSIAQHESFRAGLRPCGALYGLHINALLSHSFEKVGVKQTFLVAACPKGKRQAGVLFLPEEHRDFAADCYRRMGVAFRMAEELPPLAESSRLQLSQDGTHQTLMGTVDVCGMDLKERVNPLLEYWRGRCPLETVTVFLNGTHPTAGRGYRLLRELGFRFAGIHPLCRNGEYVILHHPMGVAVPFEQMHVDDSYRTVFDYLKAHFDD